MNMKLTAIFLIIIFEAALLYPQVFNSYGIKIGLSSSNIVVKNPGTQTIGGNTFTLVFPEGQLLSPAIGLWAKVIEHKLFNLEAESFYLLKGLSETSTIKTNPTGTEQDYSNSWVFHYIQLNLNIQLKYQIGNITGYGIIGPSVNYLLKIENVFFDENKVKNFLFGYNLGIGFEIMELMNKNIFIEAKYNGDFTSFFDEGSGEFWNKVWVFNLGVRL